MIRIEQDQPIRGYQIPTFGMREIHQGELIPKDSKLGKALLDYFPSICRVEEVPEVVTVPEEVIVPEAEAELLIEDPEAPASVEEVPEVVTVPEEVVVPEAETPEETKRGRKSKN